jgi:hypothetical protein
MIFASAVASVLQIAALCFAGMVSIEVTRKQTLSKNFAWVLENQDFAKRYNRPEFWPLALSAMLVVSLLFYGILRHSLHFMMWGKIIGVFGALIFLTTYYYIQETLVGRKIPSSKERTATFIKRTITQYIPPNIFFTANAAAVLVVATIAVSFALHKISMATFIYDLAGAILCYGACYGGIFWTMNEKIPHKNDTDIVTKVNVSENYRVFSFRLLVAMSFCISGLLLLQVGLQWFGVEFCTSPLLDTLHRLTGEQKTPSYFISSYLDDIIASAFSIPLFLYIAQCKAYRDIRAISVIR